MFLEYSHHFSVNLKLFPNKKLKLGESIIKTDNFFLLKYYKQVIVCIIYKHQNDCRRMAQIQQPNFWSFCGNITGKWKGQKCLGFLR